MALLLQPLSHQIAALIELDRDFIASFARRVVKCFVNDSTSNSNAAFLSVLSICSATSIRILSSPRKRCRLFTQRFNKGSVRVPRV